MSVRHHAPSAVDARHKCQNLILTYFNVNRHAHVATFKVHHIYIPFEELVTIWVVVALMKFVTLSCIKVVVILMTVVILSSFMVEFTGMVTSIVAFAVVLWGIIDVVVSIVTVFELVLVMLAFVTFGSETVVVSIEVEFFVAYTDVRF